MFNLKFSEPSEYQQWMDERARLARRLERESLCDRERRAVKVRLALWALFTFAVLFGAVLGSL